MEAYLELFNHDAAAIEPLLGFEFLEQSFSSQENRIYWEEQIRRFVLSVNNEPQRFEYGHRYKEHHGPIHTLVYQTRLHPGKNTVYHKYELPYGTGSLQGVVSYILETGSRWKDGIIKDIEIYIRAEENMLLRFDESGWNPGSVVRSFQTIGESKLYQVDASPPSDSRPYYTEYYSLTPNGYLYKRMENFIAKKNINFQTTAFTGMPQYQDTRYDDPPYSWPRFNPFILLYDWTRYIEDNEYRRWVAESDFLPADDMLEPLSSEQLRILRNSIYALHGLVFTDPFLREYFTRQYWYYPNPNISVNRIVLSPSESTILEYIIAEERRR